MAKLSVKGLLIIAFLLSLLTSTLVYNYLKGAALTANKPGVPIYVAKVDIPPKTKITQEMLQEVRIPAEYVQPGSIRDPRYIVGISSREKITIGEHITESRLLSGKTMGFSGVIPTNKRAITVAVTEVSGVAGFIKPGDYVDVVATFDKNDTGEHTSNVVIQNLLVLASNHDTENQVLNEQSNKDKEKKDVTKTTTVTLAVDPSEAPKLALAEDKGKIRLALRPVIAETGIAMTETSTPTKQVGYHEPPKKDNQVNVQLDIGGSNKEATVRIPEHGVTVYRGTKPSIVPTF